MPQRWHSETIDIQLREIQIIIQTKENELKRYEIEKKLAALHLALRMVNIPLTAFAFLGGAIAIGMGFGAQNLINNFISGFMIIGERREIESNVRFKIDQLFSEAGLVIAFPQRDVHLETLKPLQINIEHGAKN
ncbi:mechanosensitive ion channel domain-containing protein [Desulfobacter sp.]|uniref:mechanosensitive ion channel domain-containing protein n=1 Tax=Desulfobacter sp. TaxID=2294 RepID=UPI00257A14F6|nr:mechanosensitive ion channel domain-containing protein [Desulfobacter sp.]